MRERFDDYFQKRASWITRWGARIMRKLGSINFKSWKNWPPPSKQPLHRLPHQKTLPTWSTRHPPLRRPWKISYLFKSKKLIPFETMEKLRILKKSIQETSCTRLRRLEWVEKILTLQKSLHLGFRLTSKNHDVTNNLLFSTQKDKYGPERVREFLRGSRLLLLLEFQVFL